ncbi:MAG: zinc-ribbon domain-containing protein [Clostridia bacterium]|nr:zinc-ribbon domain-containing protein [Clostridia bacterium]
MSFCKNCGTQLSDNSKFCSNCGYKAEETSSNESTESIEIDNSQNDAESEIINPQPTNRFKETYRKIADKLFLGGLISAAFGTILFVGIILVSLIGWGKVYLYSGDYFTATLTTISLFFMLLGLIVLTCVSLLNRKFKSIKLLTKKSFILSIVLIVSCIGLSVWGFIDYASEQDSGSSYGDGSYNGGYNDYYSSGIDKSIGLSLKVDSIKTSGSYTYVYCTVTNVSSKYVATRYRYVKVKAQFKNYSGSIVDTDWTYAIDSTWLEPGESKTFYYMVRNTNIKSATLSFVD